MKNLVAKLKMTMKLYNGIGLSANQCGIFQRVFVIGTEHFQIACINPKVVAKSEELSRDNEGCLSFPGMFLKVERPTWVDAEFYDETGAFKQIRLEGLTAKCFLHELDHMNGVKFVEHAGPLAVQMARQRQGKLVKQLVRINKNAKKMGNKK
jgi:peptide deformylase